MQVLSEHRERVIEQLSAGFAGDRFEVEELERRVALAHTVESPEALEALVMDLVPVSQSSALVPAKKMRVVFGSIERVGPWTVPAHLATRVVFGNLLLDLRDAHLAPGGTTIEVSATFGNVEVIVPPGVAVELDVDPTLGNVEDHSERGATTTTVRITGRANFANIEVSTRLRGESRRDARWRRRRERRARRHAADRFARKLDARW